MGERVVSDGATAALGTSALTRRDVSCVIVIVGFGLGSKPVVRPVREGCCGGVRGGGNGEELLTACAAVLGRVFVVAGGVEVVVESNHAGGGNSVAF